MLVKGITLFLIAMAVLAMFGRLRVRRRSDRGKRPATFTKCRACGAPIIGKGPCACRNA